MTGWRWNLLLLLLVLLGAGWMRAEALRRENVRLMAALSQGSPEAALLAAAEMAEKRDLSPEEIRLILGKMSTDRMRTVLATGPAALPSLRRQEALPLLRAPVWRRDPAGVIGAVLAGLRAVGGAEARAEAEALVVELRRRAPAPAAWRGVRRVEIGGWRRLDRGPGIDLYQALAWTAWAGAELAPCEPGSSMEAEFAWCSAEDGPWHLGIEAGQVLRALPVDRKAALLARGALTSESTERPGSALPTETGPGGSTAGTTAPAAAR